jgi:hypothetical protein
MLDKLTSADFQPLLHETFRVTLDTDLTIDLELVTVTDLKVAGAARQQARTPFSLEFLGPVSHEYMPQHIYPLEHAAFGTLEIFLVPLGPISGRMRYEAIFT